MVIRGAISKLLPFVSPHPQALIGNPKYTLADVYALATQINVIPRHRQINNRIRRQYFEQSVGMINTESKSGMGLGAVALLTASVGIVGAVLLLKLLY